MTTPASHDAGSDAPENAPQKATEITPEIARNRRFMHCPAFENAMGESDQSRGIAAPAHAKLIEGLGEADIIRLEPFVDADGKNTVVTSDAYTDLLDSRRSRRVYFDETLSQAQLAFMLWSAIGVQAFRGVDDCASLRPSPSGGARHPFNLYVAVRNVEGVEPGLYLYLPLGLAGENVGTKEVAITRVGAVEDYVSTITDMMAGQKWASRAPAVIVASCDAYRAEWRYEAASHRVMLIDLGHLGQNLMLSATAMGLGSCCMAAF
ncbi:MAG: SagB/ThcOx family dehydrogenase, partial [Coriobacteriia bacterium]|nr:SagB/ThcOx family dehydrogenase [Coriobacteriia bacterium]